LVLNARAAIGGGRAGVGVLIGARVTQGMLFERAGAPMVRFSPTLGADEATGNELRNIEILELPVPKPYWPVLRYILDTDGPMFMSVPDGAGLDGQRNLELVRLYFDTEQKQNRWYFTNIWGSFSGSKLNASGAIPLPNPGRLEHNLTYAVAPDQGTRVLNLLEAEPPWPAELLHNFSFPVYYEGKLVYGRSVHTLDGEALGDYRKQFGAHFGEGQGQWQMLYATDFSAEAEDLDRFGISRKFVNHSRCVRVLLNSLRANTTKTFMPPRTRSVTE
ncbi:MAG: hypothetical protein KDD39_16190, partial [Bdellovibrionales bacterium]|nr:hypothetical protein [Bdellovibrionales bacterium]